MRIRHKKSLHVCIIFKEGKNGEKRATGKEKEKEHQYLHCLDFLPLGNYNMSSQKMMDIS